MSISQECTTADCKANLYQSNSVFLDVRTGKKSRPRKWSKVFHSLLAFRYSKQLLSRSFLWSKEFPRRKWPHTFGQMSAAFQAWLFSLLNSIRACKLHSNTMIWKISPKISFQLYWNLHFSNMFEIFISQIEYIQ